MPAPALPPDAMPLRSRGSSPGGLRQFNERVVLQAIRLHGPLPGAELARLTQLTAQTISLIGKRLLDDGLLLKGAPQRGRVGQPSVPLALNPDGAYGVGIEVGRRSVDVLLVDFTGAVRARWSLAYRWPEPQALLAEIASRLTDIRTLLGPDAAGRVQGIGLAMPFSLGGWQTLLDMPPAVAARWPATDLRTEVQALGPWPVHLLKDTAAACVAELVAGCGRHTPGFLYVFVDTFIGGGLVLDGHLRAGAHGNAGAIGSLSLAAVHGRVAAPAQLLSVASLNNLERLYQGAGLDGSATADERAMQPPWAPLTQRWLADAGAAIAFAVHGAACLLDLADVVIDGSFSRRLQAALLQSVEHALAQYDWEGVQAPRLQPGSIGPDARAIGGALLPLHASFAPDRDLFLKIAVE